ncbi:MAG: polysaccharide biosynthesis tyrosine autokinase [Cyclobacteriaceae bacterium]|nr:polysaccharide biosynthesis tyrosine autokinase [Cyclobacteriaceae bacterium]
MKELSTITTQPDTLEGIDISKLRVTAKNNWLWMLLIFAATNITAYLYIRYTQDLFESSSVLKLDVKQDATEMGLYEFMPENQQGNIISGEIENIQSRSFLSQVIDSLNLQVSYYSIGKFLNTELYKNSPFAVNYQISSLNYYNMPVTITPVQDNSFELDFGPINLDVKGRFGDTLRLDGLKLFIDRIPGMDFQSENTYSFIINSRDALLDYLSTNLTVEPLKFEANTIRVAFKDNNPAKARDLVNGIDSIYIAYSQAQKNRANLQKIDWLSSELQNIEKRLESYETYFEEFILENRTNNLEADLQKTIELINAIDSQRFEINRRLIEVNELITLLNSETPALPMVNRRFFPDYLNKNIEALQQLYLEMDKMKLSYNENTFAYRQKNNQVQNVKGITLEQLTGLRSNWSSQLHQLNQSKARLEREFAAMPDKNTQFSKKQRFYKLYEEFYLTLLQNRSQFEIAQAGSTPDFKILATASTPVKPISPNRPIILGIGLVAGIVLNLFFLGVLYLANNKINSVSEIERMSKVPLLGIVPAMRRPAGNDIYIARHPRSMVSEAIRTLRTNMDYFKAESAKKVITISSTVSGEGKSFIAMNLGGIMSLSNKKVILVDLDMRKEKTHTYFPQTDKQKGVSNILIGKYTWQECRLTSTLENFDFLPAGPHPPNPAELLMSDAFHRLLEELKSTYDYILLDTPPVGVVTDGIMAMKQSDLSIYILRSNYSKKEFINNLHRLVRLNKLQHITVVLNALPADPDTTYGYGYYEEEKQPGLKSLFKRHA